MTPMKFYGAMLAYVVIGAILGFGILKAVHGSYWLLIASTVTYVITFAVIGCLPPNKAH
jgi:hypothetical protein